MNMCWIGKYLKINGLSIVSIVPKHIIIIPKRLIQVQYLYIAKG
jgi:hypothetical protein